MRFLLVFLSGLLVTTQVMGQQLVAEDVNEPRIRDIAAMLRCPVCQSENILDSQASIAQEMLALLREQVEAGVSDEAIILFFRRRYGDYVLLKPATDGPGLFLWLLPVGFCALFGLIAFRLIRALRRSPPVKGELLDETRLDEMEV